MGRSKKTDKVYPTSSISLLILKTESGKLGTGWINKSYEKYPSKKFCPYNFLIMVDLTDDISQKNPDLDFHTIEEFFINELRKICVAHIVARVVTDKGINIEMYLEFLEPALKHLKRILEDPNRIVSFDCLVSKDPEWKAVSQLMKI